MPHSDTIDSAALDRLQEWGGDRLLRQMIRLFLENSGMRFQQIQEGCDSEDVRGIERGAHSLKSSAGNVGAVEVRSLAEAMEDAAMQGEVGRACGLVDRLDAALEAARSSLQEIERGISE